MRRCHCGCLITPGAEDCQRCGARVDGTMPEVSGGRSRPESSRAEAGALAVLFTLLAIVWPIATFAIGMLFDAPSNHRFSMKLLFYVTAAYGPVYLIALVFASGQSASGDYRSAAATWGLLCGGNVALWFVALLASGLS